MFVIHGPYQVGTELSVTPQGQDTFRSVITELVPNEVYADQTRFGDLLLTFRHRFEPADGTLKVTHELTIDGDSADAVGPELGASVSEDYPAAMQSLFDLAAQAAERSAMSPT